MPWLMSSALEPDLSSLLNAAEQLAARRGEPMTTLHLLAAVAGKPSRTAQLLLERQISEPKLLGFSSESEPADVVALVQRKARDISARMGVQRPGAVHALLAILSDSKSAGRTALYRAGVDVARLRATALNLGLGRLSVRRSAGTRSEVFQAVAGDERPTTGVAIPVFPPPTREARRIRPEPEPDPDPDPGPEPEVQEQPPEEPMAKVAPAEQLSPRQDEGRFSLCSKRFPTLTALGTNLTAAARRKELDPVIGREGEIEQALDVLAKRHANNPLILGAAGVGKTSIVKGLAQRIVNQNDGRSLDERVVVEIAVSELIAGTGVRGALSQRLSALRKEVAAAEGRVVVFFDEVHLLFGADLKDEVGSELKLALARGELPCIGATTFDDYKKTIEPDAALARRFSIVEVSELSREEAYLVLDSVKKRYERHHGVRYDEAALALSIAWSQRYLPGRCLPDKALSILDLAGARAHRRGQKLVEPQAVAEVVATLAEMPVERLLESDSDRMLKLEEILEQRVVGHRDPIRRIARILRRNAAGLGGKRPIGTFLLLGPTGVGKTETAKAIAEVLFHNEQAMTRIDLSEYSEAHSVAKLIGAPPGYIGHESGGQLTEAVRRRPYQVVLLDEIEKAHPQVLTTFLAVFDEGRMTDGRGRFVDFCNTVLLMTSNLGADVHAGAPKRVGFGAMAKAADARALEQRVVGAARDALSPELYNRIDEVVVYRALNREDVRRIARLMLEELAERLLTQRGVRLQASDEVYEHLLNAGGFDPELGARPMRRTVARVIEAPLAERILSGELQAGDVALLSVDDGRVVFDAINEGRDEAPVSAAE